MSETRPETPTSVGDVIVAAIRQRRMTIAALARCAGVRYDYLNAITRNQEPISTLYALKIAPEIGMEPEALLLLQVRQNIEVARKKMALRDHSPRPA